MGNQKNKAQRTDSIFPNIFIYQTIDFWVLTSYDATVTQAFRRNVLVPSSGWQNNWQVDVSKCQKKQSVYVFIIAAGSLCTIPLYLTIPYRPLSFQCPNTPRNDTNTNPFVALSAWKCHHILSYKKYKDHSTGYQRENHGSDLHT